ncbi:MAG: antitoxin Xre/MbcA/ParS toxin-binding domain-containing protein [Gemmatimonadaceae bacterium]
MGASYAMSPDVAELWKRVREGHRDGHYYVALFGLRKYDPLHLFDQIQHGLTYAAFVRFQRNSTLPQQVLARAVDIPERTLARRKESGRFEPGESDRLVRISRIVARAIELFEGNADDARQWLTNPARALGGRTPIELASTDVGVIEVDNVIGRLEHGIPT